MLFTNLVRAESVHTLVDFLSSYGSNPEPYLGELLSQAHYHMNNNLILS